MLMWLLTQWVFIMLKHFTIVVNKSSNQEYVCSTTAVCQQTPHKYNTFLYYAEKHKYNMAIWKYFM